MPTLNLFTNIPVDPVVASDVLKDATKAVAKIIGKPESVKSQFSNMFTYACICRIFVSKFVGSGACIQLTASCLIIFLFEKGNCFSAGTFFFLHFVILDVPAKVNC